MAVTSHLILALSTNDDAGRVQCHDAAYQYTLMDRCTEVAELEPSVRELYIEYHAKRFVNALCRETADG